MKTKTITGTFEETAEYQNKYESLISICDAEGTMVSQDRLLEKDEGIAPYRFFRRGTRDYVFPKQKVSLLDDKSRVIDPSAGYGLKTEEQTFNFDETSVDGRIKIEYEDAGNRPILQVSDVLGNSKIPKGIAKIIDTW